MTLDVDALLDHLNATVQFYDNKGHRSNCYVLTEIRTALESFNENSAFTHARRFKLVEIAFDRTLANQFYPGVKPLTSDEIAIGVVGYADDVLAAMEKKPDTGPPPATIIPLILQRLQKEIVDGRTNQEEHPTRDEGVKQFRSGCECGLKRAAAVVKEVAMEKTGEAENV